MAELTRSMLLDLAKANNVEGINTKTNKADLTAALEAANVSIPGFDTEEIVVQAEQASGPVARTALGKFPGRKLEAKRTINGAIKLTQVRVEVEGKKTFQYEIALQDASGKISNLASMKGSYEDAKFASRDQAMELQCAFDVNQDYTRASQ